MKHSILFIIGGGALIALGMAVRYKIAQRKFNRRGVAGLEGFPSYGKAVITRFVEAVAGLLAKLAILAGILLMLYCYL